MSEKPTSEPEVLTVSTCFDWLPPRPWTCPGCGAVLVTREAGPRCPTCGYREAAD
jgi:rubrerythrin